MVWGEFFPGSDVDFVAVWDELPSGALLDELRGAHERVARRHPGLAFDGFHCIASDLAVSPTTLGPRPVFFGGAFDPEGRADINPVTWHELTLDPPVVRGAVPPVHTSLPELRAYTRDNLDTYWRGIADRVAAEGLQLLHPPAAVAWVVLGAARLHHLLGRSALTSKSGAGRYVLEELDGRWERIAREALRIRERPEAPGPYPDDVDQRAREARDLLEWLIADGLRTG